MYVTLSLLMVLLLTVAGSLLGQAVRRPGGRR